MYNVQFTKRPGDLGTNSIESTYLIVLYQLQEPFVN